METTFEKLAEIIFKGIIPKMENNIGLAIFAKERAKFDDWAIELKTVNTNYRYENVENKTRPITMNIQGVIDDIEKLKSTNYINKAILFVVFPATHNHKNWKTHLQKISKLLKDVKHKKFRFKNKVPG